MDVDSNADGTVSGGSETILEGNLLKRSSHHYWNERYFVFSKDNTLSYYHKSSAERPRRSFVVSRESGCEVSSLYVSQRQNNNVKEMIYCFKLSWRNDETESKATANESAIMRDDSSVNTGPDLSTPFRVSASAAPSHHAYTPSGNILDEDIDYLFENYENDAPDQCASPLVSDSPDKRRQRHSDESKLESLDKLHDLPGDKRSGDNRSVDSDSIVLTKSASSSDVKVAGSPNMHHSLSYISNPPDDKLATGGSLHSSLSNFPSSHKKKKKKSYFPNTNKALKNLSFATGSTKKTKKERPVEVMLPPPEEDPNNASFSGGDMDMSLRRTERVQRIVAEQKMKERDKLRQQYLSKKKATKKKQQKMMKEGAKVAAAASAFAGVAVLTAGVGLVAGLAFLGVGAAAGASSSASVLGYPLRGRRSEIVIATASYEDAKLWKETIDAHLEYENLKETTWGRILFAEGHGNVFLARELGSKSSADLDDRKMNGGEKAFLFEPTTQWRPLEGWAISLLGTSHQGLRIFREEKSPSHPSFHDGVTQRPVQRILTNLSVDGGTCSPMKAHVVLNTSPLDAFMCIMSYARMMPNGADTSFCPRSEQATSFRIVESLDDHMDIIHLVFRPIYLFPSWTCPRDFVLVRYWRFEPDGSYVICYESVQHRDCPPIEGYVRGELHQAYTVSPRKQVQSRKGSVRYDAQAQECLLTAVVQVDPRGWVPISPLPFVSMKCYGDAYGIAALNQLLDIRDAIDRDRFVAVALDIEPPTNHFHANNPNETDDIDMHNVSTTGDEYRNYDFNYSVRESMKVKNSPSGLPSNPPPFYLDQWAEPDSNSFLVRGPTYKTDGVKINAGRSIGRLLAMDIVEVDAPIYSGMTKHPTERVQKALQMEKKLQEQGLESDVPPFIFVLNIIFPAEPMYHAVMYFGIDDYSEIDGSSGTPTSKLCKEFFFGDSDEFRDSTFKLIPQIVQGNFMVRKAVGSTPAIMGKKLRQLYVRDEENMRFFEIVLDCCSSSVAAGVIRLSLGYAKTVVVDLGFLFEGDNASVLPERMFGCARIKNADFSMPVRKVFPPPSP